MGQCKSGTSRMRNKGHLESKFTPERLQLQLYLVDILVLQKRDPAALRLSQSVFKSLFITVSLSVIYICGISWSSLFFA